jgi:hypothetical protein
LEISSIFSLSSTSPSLALSPFSPHTPLYIAINLSAVSPHCCSRKIFVGGLNWATSEGWWDFLCFSLFS